MAKKTGNFERSLLRDIVTTKSSRIKPAKIVIKHQLSRLAFDSANSIDSHR